MSPNIDYVANAARRVREFVDAAPSAVTVLSALLDAQGRRRELALADLRLVLDAAEVGPHETRP